MSSRSVMVITGLSVAVYLLQFYPSYPRTKYITKQYLELADKYKGEYFIGANRRKRIGCNPVVILVTDHRDMIQEFYMLNGLPVAAGMKRMSLEEGVDITELERHKNYLRGKVGEEGFHALQNTAENTVNYC